MPEKSRPRIFLDSSALFAAILSPSGGSRALLHLCAAGLAEGWIGPSVLKETDGALRRKAPEALPMVAVLLAESNILAGPPASDSDLDRAEAAISYAPDARVLAEALSSRAAFFVTLDRTHFLGNPELAGLPLTVGTPGDCLTWLRGKVGR